MNLMEIIQQYGATIGTFAALATVFGAIFQAYRAAHRKEVRVLKAQISDLRRRLADLGDDDPNALRELADRLRKELDRTMEAGKELHAEYSAFQDQARSRELAWQAERDKARQAIADLTGELERHREELAQRDRADKTRINLLKRAMKLEGRVWERKVLQGAPPFRPLAERHAPIISVLNLKGGVGKTTVTAHLGAALAAKGYRVLLMDLDLQGSLSSLFMSESALVERSREALLLQHFLMKTAERRKANLLDCCAPIFDGKSSVVPNADSMAYAELNLTLQWLLRLGRRDTRFLLRKALHQKRVTGRFDVVLLDCPPLANTCCVNALAASDYILIPVVPSRKAAERVPLLLERLQGLHRVINPRLQVLGVLLNRTHAAALTAWEKDLWQDMLDRAKDRWTLPVHAFETFIRQTTEVREGETEFAPPEPGSELHTRFARLVAEVEERLPGDCRRIATAPYGPG